ncbi:uncharacterized protein N7459_008986 [Penicillium hispanicum]|uniref:uncharacterized protein n=1 Tax=Penicillium hispanicum TaxID=1080232 RepID=UPI00254167F3|nr:uncharacterized protein N7459_008986 [Penicillium hispanicum]KAJ5569556.1 hypothetical protein N7459_008986 [Penicillium hispanicum]
MPPPEMSYSPAYHQAQGPLGTARSTISPMPRQSLERPEPSYPGRPHPSSAAEWTGHDDSPRMSGPRGSLAYSPEASRRASRVSDDTAAAVTRVSMTSGAVIKEDRSRESCVDQPSLMSAEHSGTARTHKRGASTEAPANYDQDAPLMLFRLSGPIQIYSFAACVYTCCALVFAVLVSPLRLCSLSPFVSNTSFKNQLCDLLSPALHTHERLVHMRPPASDRSLSTQWIHSDPDLEEPAIVTDSSRDYSIPMSIAVLLLSPFLSIAILLFAWTAASFWIFTMVMGNPDGTERKDDGRTAVLGVCKWWQTWLGKARRLS